MASSLLQTEGEFRSKEVPVKNIDVRLSEEDGINTDSSSKSSCSLNHNEKRVTETIAKDNCSSFDFLVHSFSKSNKLFCRRQETELLLQARVKAETSEQAQIVLIRGATGTGKTALAETLRQDQQNATPLFIKGKFDQLQRPEPHAAVVAALSDFANTIIQQNEEVERLRHAVQETAELGPEEQHVLTETIPALKRIFESNSSTNSETSTCRMPEQIREEEFSSSTKTIMLEPRSEAATINHFNHVLGLFLRTIASTGSKSTSLFLDDLHWADETDLALLRSLILDAESSRILFVLTYREEDQTAEQSLSSLFPHVSERDTSNITDIRLSNFDKEQVTDMLSDLFRVSHDQAAPLSNLVWEQTLGNVFFIFEYLRSLCNDEDIQYDVNERRWKWDIEEICIEQQQYTCVNNLISTKICALSEHSIENLKVASCLGSKLDSDILRHLLSGFLSSCFSEASNKGLLTFDENRASWRFAHDRIQELVYQMIPADERIGYHYRIGRKLWRKLDVNELAHFIFVVVGQLVIASSLMTDPQERTAVAKLSLHAGKRAVELSNFHTARVYLMHGISLLGERSWRDDYDLCVSLYNAAAEISFASGHIEIVHELTGQVLTNARCFEDTIRAQTINAYAFGGCGDLNKAIDTCTQLLQRLGETFPARPTFLHVALEMKRLKRRLNCKTNEAILRLPVMHDPKKLAVIQTLNIAVYYAFLVRPKFATLLAFRILSLSLDHGVSVFSPTGFVILATALW